MSHSKTVETRRKKAKAKKKVSRLAKIAEKAKKPGTTAGAAAPKK